MIQALNSRGGKLSIAVLPPVAEVGFNVPLLCDNEMDIYDIFRYVNTYPRGITFYHQELSI